MAADNREDAKRLGLLNDDEEDSDQEGEEGEDGKQPDEEEDEAALLDKMLKDRFLHRSSEAELEENFSDEDDDDLDDTARAKASGGSGQEEDEEKEQERIAKRFAKRARMQRLLDTYGGEEEFTESKLIDDDDTLKLELSKMKVSLRLLSYFLHCIRCWSCAHACTLVCVWYN